MEGKIQFVERSNIKIEYYVYEKNDIFDFNS